MQHRSYVCATSNVVLRRPVKEKDELQKVLAVGRLPSRYQESGGPRDEVRLLQYLVGIVSSREFVGNSWEPATHTVSSVQQSTYYSYVTTLIFIGG
jgi:hypothetical protein